MQKKIIGYYLAILATVFSLDFWAFRSFPKILGNYLQGGIAIALVYICLRLARKNDLKRVCNFSLFPLLFILLPFISSISAYLYHKQSFLHSLLALKGLFFWLLYFVLHIYRVSPRKVEQWMVAAGLIWIALTVAQQFTYPHYWFSTRTEKDEEGFFRNGLYRFMIPGFQFGVFVLFFYFDEILKKITFKSVLLTAVGLLGLYYSATRQLLATALICLFWLLYVRYRSNTALALVSVIILACSIYYLSDTLLAEFIVNTKDDLQENNIRLLSFNFYFNEYWPKHTLIPRLIGNGFHFAQVSDYGKEITRYQEIYRFFRSDIGIVGSYNTYGMEYVVCAIVFLIKTIRAKYYDKENRYIQMGFWVTLLTLPLAVHFDEVSSIPFYCFLCYLADKSVERMRVQAKQNKNDLVFHWNPRLQAGSSS